MENAKDRLPWGRRGGSEGAGTGIYRRVEKGDNTIGCRWTKPIIVHLSKLIE